MRCKNCGKRLRAKEKFCTVCGYYNSDEKDDINLETFEENDLDLSFDSSSLETDESKKQQSNEELEAFSLNVDASGTKENEFYYKDEKFLEAYIGEDYKLIKKSPFNIYAFILNWMYLLYRKMYVLGTVGLLLTGIIIKLKPKNLLIYILIMMVIIGLAFNKIYIFVSKLKVEHLLKKYEGTDNFTMENIIAKKGGVNVRNALIIYLFFLALIFFSIFSFSFNKNYNKKYWEENSENKASCMSLVKTVYKDIDKHPVTGTISQAACSINKSLSKKNYKIYLKFQNSTKITYVLYKTESNHLIFSANTSDLESLETKAVNGTITDLEKEKLKEEKQIAEDYLRILKKSNEEDTLIAEKKNTSEKVNYIFSKEEIIR